jgi:5-methylcytosine-specific restriction protein A
MKPLLEHTTRRNTEQQGHADHVIPHKGDWSAFVNIDGIELLCHSCHSEKTAREMAGGG